MFLCHSHRAAGVLLACVCLNGAANAAGTAENALLIIDPTDATSLYVGNYYKNARNIPDSNVLYLRSAASSYDTFVATVQAGFTGTLSQRKIADHLDYVVLAPLNVFSIAKAASLTIPVDCTNNPVTRFSITTAFDLAPMSGSLLSGSISASNAISPFGGTATGAYPSGNPALAFHAQTAYLNGSASSSSSAHKLFISGLLGYTQGAVGNTTQQLLTMIDRSVAADGTRTVGTYYYMNNTSDTARNARACGGTSCGTANSPTIYTNTATQIDALGGSATVISGLLPASGTSAILGVMSGFAVDNIEGAGMNLAPGAFGDELTSFAGVLDGTQSQTTVQSWITAGASGSEGMVQEPCAWPTKFPSSDFHLYYYQGMSLGESYLRSIEAIPFQSILYGDPLTRPFAYLPNVTVAAPMGDQSGTINIPVSATTQNPGAAIAAYSLLIDGVVMATGGPGQTLSLNTTLLNDGRHDMRVLATDNSVVQNVGRWTGTLDTLNYGRSALLTVNPSSGMLMTPFSLVYTPSGGAVREVRVLQNSRVVASSTAPSGTLTVYGQNLGPGLSTVRLEVSYVDGRMSVSAPVTLRVATNGTPVGVTPAAFSYSKYLTDPSAYVVELPASYDVDLTSATYTVVNTPTQSTVIQANGGGPYLILQPKAGASGSEPLQFKVTGPNGTSNTATVTLVYTPVSSS